MSRVGVSRVEGEPRLEELFTDPLTHAVMRRDGLRPQEVRRFIEAMRRRLADCRGGAPAADGDARACQ